MVDRKKLRRSLGTRTNRRRGTKTQLIGKRGRTCFGHPRRRRTRPSVALEKLIREQARATR